ncbi:hypothetical protein D3C72_2300200 [compost metagenome]
MRASSSRAVGSPSRPSSPSLAVRMRSYMAGVGWVTVSLRRSMKTPGSSSIDEIAVEEEGLPNVMGAVLQ